jgi:TonB family protein
MKQIFLSLLVISVLFLIYLKTETHFFENLSLPEINRLSTTDTAINAEEVFADSVYQGDNGEAQDAQVAGQSEAALDAVADASRSEAQYPGGMAALTSFIGWNLKYPEDERKRGINGTCVVQFVVNADGTISVPTIISPIKNGPKCNKEVIRLIKSMPEWVPATINGKDMPSVVSLPIKFEIN